MRRRKILFGSTAVLSGVALVAGARGFSDVEGQREVRIAVENDESAYLGLVPEVEFGDVFDVKCGDTASLEVRNHTNEDPIDVTVDPVVYGDGVGLDDASPRRLTIGVGRRETARFGPGCQRGTESTVATLHFDITASVPDTDSDLVRAERRIRVHCTCPEKTATQSPSGGTV